MPSAGRQGFLALTTTPATEGLCIPSDPLPCRSRLRAIWPSCRPTAGCRSSSSGSGPPQGLRGVPLCRQLQQSRGRCKVAAAQTADGTSGVATCGHKNWKGACTSRRFAAKAQGDWRQLECARCSHWGVDIPSSWYRLPEDFSAGRHKQLGLLGAEMYWKLVGIVTCKGSDGSHCHFKRVQMVQVNMWASM